MRKLFNFFIVFLTSLFIVGCGPKPAPDPDADIRKVIDSIEFSCEDAEYLLSETTQTNTEGKVLTKQKVIIEGDNTYFMNLIGDYIFEVWLDTIISEMDNKPIYRESIRENYNPIVQTIKTADEFVELTNRVREDFYIVKYSDFPESGITFEKGTLSYTVNDTKYNLVISKVNIGSGVLSMKYHIRSLEVIRPEYISLTTFSVSNINSYPIPVK